MTKARSNRPEVWGGVECTVARIRNRWRDQLAETGHRDRPDDIAEIAALGIRTLRYPVLWESVSPETPGRADFSWHDDRMRRLRDAGIRPVVGLVHHGSGPHYTNLLDPAFPDLLARHAARVAERYPWVDAYTPVNEPLTTARFSALYGHWYPHRRNVRDFAQALVNQCRATAAAMKAVRRVNPQAALIQTEDLGRTFSTPLLGYQADYENERRWLTFDLLTGRVGPDHPWFEQLLEHGIERGTLLAMRDQPCPPDVIGINHYLTSDRFLEHRRGRWPAGHRGGGNGRHRYADLEAVRVPLPPGSTGAEARLRETWDRYRLPIAITEAHHGCSRDEQLRWLHEVWTAANTLHGEGVDIRAVTVWALFGTMDWSSLLTRRDGCYEPGAFDVRSPRPRRTALGRAAQALVRDGRFDHPVLDTKGWWLRDERFYQPSVTVPAPEARRRRPVLIVGGAGGLGRALARIADHRGLEHVHAERSVADVPAALDGLLAGHEPWAVIHAAEYGTETGPEAMQRRSREADAAVALAAACSRADIAFAAYSTDQVFASRAGPRPEGDAPDAAGSGGTLAAQAERAILEGHHDALVIRTGPTFGPWDNGDILARALLRLASDLPIRIADALESPAYLPDLAHATFDLLIDGDRGIWHLVNDGAVRRADLIRSVARAAGLDASLVDADGGPTVATALTSERGRVMPTLDSAIARYLRDCEFIRHLREVAEATPRAAPAKAMPRRPADSALPEWSAPK